MTGRVIDFQTGQPLSANPVTVSTSGLTPAPTVRVTTPDFELTGVTPNSVFYAVVNSQDYRATYSTAIEVADVDLDGFDVRAISEAYLGGLATSFGVTPSASTGVLLAQLVDSTGTPRAGIPASEFAPIAGAAGPFFLDAALGAAPTATATSASGWVVFFQVAAGSIAIASANGTTHTLEMPTSPVAPATATIAMVSVADGPPTLPSNVSFQRDVTPIFTRRGCQACHSGGGIGKDLANLTLDGSTNLIYRELMDTATTSTVYPRVDRPAPEHSLVLTMPSAETPPDAHPNVIFTGPTDPDYLTLLVWIREGALQN